jgi:exodeoxyribonuclease-3
LRIDLILASEVLRRECRAAAVDRAPRTWERASDHTPVTLDIADGS